MRLKTWLAVKACLVTSFVARSDATPSVNVALRAAFGAPPYLVELLETAAQENSTAYFGLLDRIADGYFDGTSTDQELYTKFRTLLEQDGHISTPEDLSSFDLALSIHSAAPRVEAQYQFYNTAIRQLFVSGIDEPEASWIHVPATGQAHYSQDLDPSKALSLGDVGQAVRRVAFDRVLGDETLQHSTVLYADIMSESFRTFHKTVSRTAREGKTSYRVRYRPTPATEERPLTVSGYGVELALKRTDYIVIDDRQAADAEKVGGAGPEASLDEQLTAELRPLSTAEVQRLSVKAATFVMNSEDRLDSLVKLTQDFPKHSSYVASLDVSEDLIKEYEENGNGIIPPGFNGFWINGVQKMPRDIEPFALLEDLRHERKLINSVRSLGLTSSQAIDLLSHKAISTTQAGQDVERYDWRDDREGGKVIVWLNDIERDERYNDWPETVMALLQRTFPGQMPSVRKDIHNVIMPVDLSNYSDVVFITETMQTFVARRIPIRFGFVPRTGSESAMQQAKIIYYLDNTYGISAALRYLIISLQGEGRKFGNPKEINFSKAIEGLEPQDGQIVLDFQEIFRSDEIESQIKSAQEYGSRLALTEEDAPSLVNGVAVPSNDEWFQAMSQRLSVDLQMLQRAVYMQTVSDESYLPEIFLSTAIPRRMPLIVPEDDSQLRHIRLSDVPELANLPNIAANLDTIELELMHLTIVADLDSLDGFVQVMEALLFQREHDNVQVAWLHTPGDSKTQLNHEKPLDGAYFSEALAKFDAASIVATQEGKIETLNFSVRKQIFENIHKSSSTERKDEKAQDHTAGTSDLQNIPEVIGLSTKDKALIASGRIVGPVPEGIILKKEDVEVLLAYERKLRLLPASIAIKALKLEDKATTPLEFAMLSNAITLSQRSDVPEGIYESTNARRVDFFQSWNTTHSAITLGDRTTANVQVTLIVDPASEIAQRWVPIVKVLSELQGVYTRIFLNPKEQLNELPVKRFYRQVLRSRPTFDEDGSVKAFGALFTGLPQESLLNMGMDLPPSWLVAPKESIHDLDNIKLSAIKTGADIDAIYELEHILIEGHSTDDTTGQPPRGAQLVLSTEKDPHFADTIIMANLGYFQFKANPGVYDLRLREGRSNEIFKLDTAGLLGSTSHSDDGQTEIALMSFRGATLFPRLSRKPGMEEADVLQPSKSTFDNLADGADKLLAQAGLSSSQIFSKAAKLGNSLLPGSKKSDEVVAPAHADINIFSVASGHLYERMLNIMMLSVMKHTNHTVKFWFIEQFLSPSFKDFLPTLAKEYNFQFEMVTYKWPHWLRAQKEKQREIWGYKILFLDVLFPLDLDKVIFVDADQIVRTDMYELVQHDLEGAPYGFTPMCDSRVEMEGFRFWKQGYWEKFLQGLPYHISALYVVDLKKFRQIAAGDRLRQQYHQLAADPNSLANLDQDLPNHMQSAIPIHSLPQDWLWCETWCSDEALRTAKTIDLCNNPQTKEPKLDRARRQVPEWTLYDDEIAAVAKRYKESRAQGRPIAGQSTDAGVQGKEEESIQERLQREDAEREQKARQIKHNEL